MGPALPTTTSLPRYPRSRHITHVVTRVANALLTLCRRVVDPTSVQNDVLPAEGIVTHRGIARWQVGADADV